MRGGVIAVVAALLASLGPAARAGAATAAGPSCQMTLSELSFGRYDPLSPRPADSAGAVTIACSGVGPDPLPDPLAVGLAASSGTAAEAGTRRMTAGAGGALSYNLYRDPARQQVWGDGTNGYAQITVEVHDAAAPARVDFYGRIPARQNVVPGAYHDEILVTLTF